MPEKKKKLKVIPHCYRRSISKTLSNSSVSQLVRIGSYKKRINDLSRNNRHLATALQEARLEAAVQHNIVKDCAKDCNKILFARLKLNEMAKNFAKFVTDLEEVRSYLNVEFLTENPFTYRKGSPSDKLCKEPAINCIEEVTEESSVNEVVASENVSTAANISPDKPDDNEPDVGLSNQGSNADVENMEIAPILFADDSEEKKKKKSSNKSKASKKFSDPDKGSLTPELNVDLTCLKLKRTSSRRQTQVFQFPGSRSTSRGKATSFGIENSPKELVTPEKSPTPTFAQQKLTQEEIFKNTISNDTEEKENENPNSFPENHPESALKSAECNFSDASTLNLSKKLKTVTAGNHTVLLCEDMELTDVIRPVHEIIVQNGFPFAAKSVDANLGCDITKDIKENGVVHINDETKENNNREIISEKDSQDLFSAHPNTSKLLNDDDVQLPEINENDEVQNVGLITFCESNVKDKHTESRATVSPRKSRKTKPVKYAIYFSSDESDEDSPFNITTKAVNKRKTAISVKSSKTSEKTGDPVQTVNSTKSSKTSEKTKDPVQTVISTKTGKTSEKTKDPVQTVISTKTDKISEKTGDPVKTVNSTKPSKTSEKTKDTVKTVSSTKTGKSSEKTEHSIKTISSTKTCKSKKTEYLIATVDTNETGKSSERTEDPITCHKVPLEKEIKKDLLACSVDILHSKKVEKKSSKRPKDIKSSSKNDLLKQSSQKHSEISNGKNLKLNKNVKKLVSHQENIKSPINENIRKLIFSPDVSSPSILKKTQPNFQTTKEIGVDTLLNKVIYDDNLDDSLTDVLETQNSESKKVSFAPIDTVCNFRRMSVSKKIAENKKVRRTSKSALDFDELFENELQTKTVGTDNSSETANVQRSNNPVFNFSDDTELYSFQIPSNSNFTSVATTDDLLSKFSTSNASQKNINKNDKHLNKIVPVPKAGKLSLKRSKDPKNTEPLLMWDEISKRRNALLCESPVSVSKPTKRKSLFKEYLDGDSKENINANNVIVKIPKNVLQEKDINMNPELSSQNNHFKKPSTKRQSKVQRKVSSKKLSDNPKLPESAPEIKRVRQSVAVKGLENSPVLKDTVNLPGRKKKGQHASSKKEAQEEVPLKKRRSKPVSYREPLLNKKMRRE